MKPTTRILTSLLLMLGLAALSAGQALAAVAANTQIVNRATMSYYDGTVTQTSSSTVTVTVALVPSAPEILPGPPQTTPYNGDDTKLINSFTMIASANGPDSYTLTTAITESSNTTDPTATVTDLQITLGATVTLTGSTTTVLVVPADGSDDGAVNAIAKDDLVKIGNLVQLFVVTEIADNATGTSTISIAPLPEEPALATAPGPGVLIAEAQVVTVDVTAGQIATAGTDVVVKKNLTATSTTNIEKKTTSSSITDTYPSGLASLVKYARNVTVANGSGAITYDYDTKTYYRTGVQASPGHVLEYLLVATNLGSGEVSLAKIEDILPTDFVTFKSNAYLTGDVTYVDHLGAVSELTEESDIDTANYAPGTSTLTVYVGTGATSSTGGAIPAESSVLVLYQVTIKP